MGSLYNFSILLYSALMNFLSLFHPKAKLWVNGRKDLKNRIQESSLGKDPAILIHCSSLGEFEQGRPLLEKIKKIYPSYKIILSFFSPSGFEIEKNNKLADLVIYLPIDTKSKVKFFVESFNIKKAFFIKYEYWPNLFSALKEKNCSIYMVSAIFRADQYFFKSKANWYRNHTLKLVDHFFVQNEQSAIILKNHKFENYSVTGDTRFDRVSELSQSTFSNNALESFIKTPKKILIAGSSWLEDEKIIIEFLKKNSEDWKLILAPHEIHENHLKQIESLTQNLHTIRFSKAQKNELSNIQILIIDNIGLLKYLYRYADLCYIGGGFGAGIHNTLEAVTYAKPVIFGPKYHKFEEAKQLIQIGAGRSIENLQELESAIKEFMEPENYSLTSKKAAHFIHQHKGATDKILDKTLQ